MTWPTGPPPMPPSGWYDDPEQPWTWRYWDGARWTDHRAPMWVSPPRDGSSFSVWFERSIAVVGIAVRRIGLVLLAVWGLLGVAGWVVAVSTFDGGRGRELRRLLDFEQSSFGGSRTVELTDAEAERAWELIQDMFWSALPWMVLLAVSFVLVSAWSVALAVSVQVPRVAEQRGDEPSAVALGGQLSAAVRRVPSVVGSGVVVFLVLTGVWVVAALPVVLVAVLDGGGAAIVLTSVFVALLAGVVTSWLWVRLSLSVVLAAAGGHGLGVRRSWDLTGARFWYAAGRLIITGLIAGAASGAVNSIAGFGQFLGLAAYLAIVFTLQAVAAAASVLITTAGHLVTSDQLDTHR